MKYKRILFYAVLAVFIFGAASVCASDMNDAVIASEDDSTFELSQEDTGEMISSEEDEIIGQTENDELVSEGNSGTFAELQANITAAKPGSTLTLNKNYEWESGFDIEGIRIDKSITIDGNGSKIDAHGNSRIFKITADNVILKNIIFTNGKTTENGGTVYFEKSGNVTNCNFINNNGGGAVFFAGKGEVANCNFADNYATYGGAVYFSDSGTVANCNFTRNSASKNGGVVYFQNTGVVRNCNFKNGASKNNGGSVFFEKSGKLTNCNFTDSAASNTGGAVFFSGLGTVANCSFVDNIATGDYSYGGAVFFSGDGDVTNCNFTGNTAKMGNAIYISNHGTISDCDFTTNPITDGAIHSVTGDIVLSDNVLNVDDTVKDRNFTEIQKLIDASNDGDEISIDGLYAGFGIPIRITKSLTIIGQNNAILDAKKLSKILHITANNVKIENIQFTNGYAENGGAVYFYGAGNVANCNFTDNEVIGEKSSGGAIYFNGAGNVINSIFTFNKATGNGGAIYVEAQSKNNNFSSQFYNNYAGQSGGAIFFHNSVQNNDFECIFKDNYAGYGGGMFFSKNADANRFNSDFINNTALSCGGAMFFYSTSDRNNFTGRFINNSALGQIDPTNGNGGAITFKNVSTNSIFTCDFINNSASLNGGGVNYRETPKNIIFNANFINNTSPSGGGVNFFETFENVIFNGEFIGNSAQNGGAIAAKYGNIKKVSFKNNYAKNDGGAVYFALSGSTVDCNFTNNRATHSGGAVYVHEKCNVVNCSFADNTADYNGGAVYSKSGAVKNSNFTCNVAKNDGGAVYLGYPSNVANCHFAHNSALNGGALYFLNDNDNVINCSFIANEAVNRGGAVFFMTPEQVNVTNCYFEGNSAPEGGAVFCYRWAVTADSCIFKTDSDTTNNTDILSPTLNVYGFYSVHGSGEKLTFNLTTNSGMPITNGNISITVYSDENDRGAVNYNCLSGEGWIVDLPVGSYNAVINTEYKGLGPIIRTIEITMPTVQFYINVTSLTTNNKTVNITAKSNIPKNLLWDGKFLFILPDGTQINASYASNDTWWAIHAFDHCGEYEVNALYVGLDNVAVKNATITVNKSDSTITLDNAVVDYGDSINVKTEGAISIIAKIDGAEISVLDNHVISLTGLNAGTYNLTVTTIPDEDHYSVILNATITVNPIQTQLIANEVTAIYNANKYLTITLKDANGNPISGVSMTVVLNGAKTYLTDANGQVKVSTKAIAPKKYSAKVTFNGNANYLKSSKTIKVTVKKATPKLAANKKTFKKSVKVKKYTITLKYGKAPLKKVKVYVKIKGKTYKATTNSKGKAIFKIKKLTRKGTFKSKIIFKGNKYYNKVTKKVKIKVK